MSNLTNIVQKARKDPSVFKSNEFIHYRLFSPDLYLMLLEMGPNCNLACAHCCVEAGPMRKGLPDKKTTDRAFGQAYRAGLNSVVLTSGEPIRKSHEGVLEAVAKASRHFSIQIISNGTFAQSKESALEWFKFLARHDLDFERTIMRVSLGSMYPTGQAHVNNALHSLAKVKKGDVGRFISFLFLKTQDTEGNRKRLTDLVDGIYDVLGKVKKYSYSENRNDQWIKCHTKRGDIQVCIDEVSPHGRARHWMYFDKRYPVKELDVEDLFFEADYILGPLDKSTESSILL